MNDTSEFERIIALLLPALGETLAMVAIVMFLVVLLGTPLGVLVFNLSEGGLFPNRLLHGVLSWLISIMRSLPFLVLMAALIPFTRLVVGTSIGIPAAVVPMTLAGTAFFSRIVENAIRAQPVMLATIIALVLFVGAIQLVGDRLVRRATPELARSAGRPRLLQRAR
ncbi:hypothetical protein B5M43_009640 [Microbacterium sp. MEC084]|uniref:hypothetical protein n=1 Tax=Microbacterium sp. MEC084 TaxID=1963027 RepID=UPI00106F3EA4|nr:hypothetical protein [Microbacterium sp. MEC084]MCD1269097.1 hypothetical protein [Microbacterium sp. MEC084]